MEIKVMKLLGSFASANARPRSAGVGSQDRCVVLRARSRPAFVAPIHHRHASDDARR
jgi:hypothetical protein